VHLSNLERSIKRWRTATSGYEVRARVRGCRRSDGDHASLVRTAFYIFGAVAELIGIVLVAAPDLVPGAVRVAGWARRRSRKIGNQLRRRIGLKPKSTAHGVEVTATARTSATVSAVKSSGAATLEAKVEFLLTRDQEAQRDVNLLGERVDRLESALSRELTSLQHHIEGRIGERLAAAQADYRAARVVGAVSLVVGLALGTSANLMHSGATYKLRPVSIGGLTEWLTALGGLGAFVATVGLAYAAFRQMDKADDQIRAMRDQARIAQEAAREEAAAVARQIAASIAQSEAIRDAARVMVQARVIGHVTGPTMTGPDETWSLGVGETAFQYRLVNEGSGPALNIRHGIELGGNEYEWGGGMETRSLGPGEASPPFNDALGSHRPLTVVVPTSELPERWAVDGYKIWARFDNALGERYETRNPNDPQRRAEFFQVTDGST
jgi:hypothetical protein